jgi:hypothetical protein
MLIATAYVEDWFAFETMVANINISWHVHASQVSDMHRTVGIR